MPANVTKLLVPLAILGLLAFTVFKSNSAKPAEKTSQVEDKIHLNPTRFLIRPFYTQGTEVGLALDGGQMRIDMGQVPHIVIGNNVLRTVHLAWVHDWTKPECLTTFKNLQTIYASHEGETLPALKIHLNPVFSDSAGEALHRAMLQVLFRADSRDFYISLAKELSEGALPANAEAIRLRVEATNPTLFMDWDIKLDWLESDIEKTLSTARVQQARNTAITATQNVDQLTSMLSTLPPKASQQELITFLQNANASQRAWLQTLPAHHDVTPAVR